MKPNQEPGRGLLEVEELTVRFPTPAGEVVPVRNLSLTLSPGETVALVGESGSGKSTTALSLLGLVPPPGRVEGRIRLGGKELTGLAPEEWRAVRGRRIAMIFQDPGASLNPVIPVGIQVAEVLRAHHGLGRRHAAERAVELLERVGIDRPRKRSGDHPALFSGGQRQRVMIAAALAGGPSVLLADEPTTALDVTTQIQIADLLLSIQAETAMSLLWISHDLGFVGGLADRVAVLDEGGIVESGPAEALFRAPGHPRTVELVAAIPSQGVERAVARPERPASHDGPGPTSPPPEVTLRGVSKTLGGRRRLLGPDLPGHPAVSDVSLTVAPGEVLGIVGESGAGKTTLARLLLGLETPDAGSIEFEGRPPAAGGPDQQAERPRIQAVFQDPYASLDPRYTVDWIVSEPLRIRGGRPRSRAGFAVAKEAPPRRPPDLDSGDRVTNQLRAVGVPAEFRVRFPRQLSGGERQRVAIARALVTDPTLIVLDEPVSSLDLTVRAQVLDLLDTLRRDRGVAFVLISHDFAVVSRMCDRVAVMLDGRIVEIGDREEVLSAPLHPHTRMLVAAAGLGREGPLPLRARDGAGVGPAAAGCSFTDRCPLASDRCVRERPDLRSGERGMRHRVACHHVPDTD